MSTALRKARLRRERMILATLVSVGRRKLAPDDPKSVTAFAKLEARLAAVGQSPPTEWEMRALWRAEVARLDARIARQKAELGKMSKLARHAKAMGLGPEDRMGVVLDKLDIRPGDPVPEPRPQLVRNGSEP